jgi:hypothetical protein
MGFVGLIGSINVLGTKGADCQQDSSGKVTCCTKCAEVPEDAVWLGYAAWTRGQAEHCSWRRSHRGEAG